MLSHHIKRAPDLERIVELSDRFDVSREAAARRYVDLHHKPLAIVFSENGRVRYVQKGGGFPSTSVWSDDQLGDRLVQPKPQRSMTDLVEVDPASWLNHADAYELYAQTLFQESGFAMTLLVVEVREPEESDLPRWPA